MFYPWNSDKHNLLVIYFLTVSGGEDNSPILPFIGGLVLGFGIATLLCFFGCGELKSEIKDLFQCEIEPSEEVDDPAQDEIKPAGEVEDPVQDETKPECKPERKKRPSYCYGDCVRIDPKRRKWPIDE